MKNGKDVTLSNELVATCDRLQINIASMIFTIRGRQVMVDRDLAFCYGVETKRLNEQVRRNIERFPERFRFQLTKEEMKELVANCDRFQSLKHSQSAPYAFTQQGISMLSTVLHSDTAVEVSIRIMDAFVSMSHFMAANGNLFQRLASIEYHQIESDKRIDEVFRRLDAAEPPHQGIFYDGQVFDAYHFVSDLIRKAKTSIVLIDNYVDDSVLTWLDKRSDNVTAKIYTQHLSQQLQLDLSRHNAQYPTIEVEHFNRAHDRFLLIDNEVYHLGASIKDLGKKWFAFTLMNDLTASEIIGKL